MTTRLLVRDLQPSAVYYVQVRAVSQDAQSEWSYRQTITTLSDISIPDPPSSVTWTSTGRPFTATWVAPVNVTNGDGSVSPLYNFDKYRIRIGFLDSGGITRYVVYETKATRFDFTYEMNEQAFKTFVSPTTLSTNTAKSPLTFEIQSVTTTPVSSAYTTPITATNPVPVALTVATPTAAVEAVNLSWGQTADLDITGFNVYASTTNGFTPAAGNRVATVNATAYAFNTSIISPWYFHVRAVDIFGQEGTSTQTIGVTPKAALTVDTVPPVNATSLTTSSAYDIPRGTATIAATWVLSTDDGAGAKDVQQYIIRYSADGGTTYDYDYAPNGVTTKTFDVVPGSSYIVQIATQDFVGNKSAYLTSTTSPQTTPSDSLTGVTPQTMPSANVVGNTLQVQVTPTGLDSTAAAMPANVTGYEVYASKTTGFTTYDQTTLIGKITKSTTTSGTFYLPVTTTSGTAADPWYVKIRAIGRLSTVVSNISAQTAVTPGLIQGINIVDATINSAKINSLVADKITAGAGIIAALTIGNATTAGDIHSFDYVSGTTGWKIGGTSAGVNVLEINNGLIKARTLELSNSPNIIPPIYADFEAANRVYFGVVDTITLAGGTAPTGVLNLSTLAADVQFGVQALSLATHVSGEEVFFGTSATDYNVPLEAGKTYVVSGYFRGTSTIAFRMYTDNAVTIAGSSTYVCTATRTRHASTITIPAGATKGQLSILTSSAGSFTVDGLQIEERNGATVTPIGAGSNMAQPWKAPSTTVIDGGQVKTGSIQSINNSTTVDGLVVPYWYINTNGAAQFSDLRVIGSVTVGGTTIAGDSGTSGTAQSSIKSYNYVSGVSGWQIGGDGQAEFVGVFIRGQVDASSGSISGILNMTQNGLISINSGSMVLGPSNILIGNQNASHIVIDPITGLTLYGTDGVTATSKLDMSSAQLSEFNGKVGATDLSVASGMLLSGTSSLLNNSVTNIAATIASPTVAPSLTEGTQTRPWSIVSGYLETGLWWDGTNWIQGIYNTTTKVAQARTLDSTGAVVGAVTTLSNTEDVLSSYYIDSAGIVKIGTFFYVLRLISSTVGPNGIGLRDWHIVKYSTTSGTQNSLGYFPIAQENTNGASTTAYPMLGYDGTNLLVSTEDVTKTKLRNITSQATAVVLKVDPATVIVGGPLLTYSSQFGSIGSTNGLLYSPRKLSFDSGGNIYVADTVNNRVQKFDATGVYVSQFGTYGTANGQFDGPCDVAIDTSGNIFVVDASNSRIQKFTSAGVYVSQFGTYGTANGQLNSPVAMGIDSSGNIYVVEASNNRISKFTSAGVYVSKFGVTGSGNGQFNTPEDIDFDASGNIYVADYGNYRIQKFTSAGVYVSKFGNNTSGNQKMSPFGLTLDSLGNIYVADYGNHRISKFNSSGTLLSRLGTTAGSANGQFNQPSGVTLDASGNIYVADNSNNRIQKILNTAVSTSFTVAGGVISTNTLATYIGIGNHDYSSSKVLFGGTAGMAVYTLSGTVLTADTVTPTWLTNSTVAAIGWDGTNFYSGNSTTSLQKYSGFLANATGVNPKFWAQYAWTDAAATSATQTATETLPSPSSSFTLTSRRYLNIGVPAVGAGTFRTRVFTGWGSTMPVNTSIYSQGVITTTAATSFQVGAQITSAINPKTVSGYLTGTPAILQSGTGGFIVKGDGTGDWPLLRTLMNTDRHKIRRSTATAMNISSTGATRNLQWPLAQGTQTGITLGAATDGAASGRFTITRAARYIITWHTMFDGSGTGAGRFTARLTLNGGNLVFDRFYRTNITEIVVLGKSITVDLAVNDYIEVEAEQTTGTTQPINVGTLSYNQISITQIDS